MQRGWTAPAAPPVQPPSPVKQRRPAGHSSWGDHAAAPRSTGWQPRGQAALQATTTRSDGDSASRGCWAQEMHCRPADYRGCEAKHSCAGLKLGAGLQLLEVQALTLEVLAAAPRQCRLAGRHCQGSLAAWRQHRLAGALHRCRSCKAHPEIHEHHAPCVLVWGHAERLDHLQQQPQADDVCLLPVPTEMNSAQCKEWLGAVSPRARV